MLIYFSLSLYKQKDKVNNKRKWNTRKTEDCVADDVELSDFTEEGEESEDILFHDESDDSCCKGERGYIQRLVEAKKDKLRKKIAAKKMKKTHGK